MTLRVELGPGKAHSWPNDGYFQEQIRSAAQQTADQCVIIDLRECECLSSRQLNSLIALNSHLRRQSRQLVLSNLSDSLRTVFELTRLDRLFLIDDGSLLSER